MRTHNVVTISLNGDGVVPAPKCAFAMTELEFRQLLIGFQGSRVSAPDRKAIIAETMDQISKENPAHDVGAFVDSSLDIPGPNGEQFHVVTFSSSLRSSSLPVKNGIAVVSMERSKSGVLVDRMERISQKVEDFMGSGGCLIGTIGFGLAAWVGWPVSQPMALLFASAAAAAAAFGVTSFVQGLRR